MIDDPAPDAPWSRPLWTPAADDPTGGDGDALVFYAVLGRFPPDLAPRLSGGRWRVSPDAARTVRVDRFTRAEHPRRFEDLLGGALGRLLDTEYAPLAPAARAAPELLTVRAEARDPAHLGHLRDAVGVVAALTDPDAGGAAAAILDGMALEWWKPGDFVRRVWEPDRADPFVHATILVSEDERDAAGRPTVWVHTRGMRKFGRPDVSARGVAETDVTATVALCNRLIAHQARGARIPDGEPVRVPGLPDTLTLHHAGSYDDPDFNNVHLAARRAAA